jgi:hypothetical protein
MQEHANHLAQEINLLDCYLGWASGTDVLMLLAGLQAMYRHPDTPDPTRLAIRELGESLRRKFRGMPHLYHVLALGWERPYELTAEMYGGQ